MSEHSNLRQANEKHWDNAAATYDAKPWQQAVVKQLTGEIRSHLDWIGVPSVKAGGEPAASSSTKSREALLPYVTQIRGIDISDAMVAEYNRRAKLAGLTAESGFAVRGNLLAEFESGTPDPALDRADLFNFDIVIVDLAFHHIERPDRATEKLVERLVPGSGVLVIVDFCPHGDFGGGSGHQDQHEHHDQHQRQHHQDSEGQDELNVKHITGHNGFSKEQVEQMFKDAGCVDVEYLVLDEPLRFGGEIEGSDREIFMARGRRA